MPDAETILRELLETVAQQRNYDKHDIKIKPITSGGANFTSSLYLATVTAPQVEDLQLFAKVANVGETMRIMMNAGRLFSTEGYVYTKLANTYLKLQEKHNICNEDMFKFPKFYGCNPTLYEETVVLENLVANGYVSYSRFQSMDWEHAASAIEVLAKFHALSFAYQKENPEEFAKTIGELTFVRPNEPDESKKGLWTKMIYTALDVIQEKQRPKVLKLMEDGGTELFMKYNVPFGRPVLIHGDYRPSNLLFKKQDDKVQTMPVDFQTVHSGCPLADLVYFIFMGTDAAFRRQHYDDLIEHYYQQLTLALQRLAVHVDDVYPRKEFDSELKEMLPYAVVLGVFLLPIVTVEAENAPRVDGDASIESFVVEPNALFAERFAGIADDCVRLGVI